MPRVRGRTIRVLFDAETIAARNREIAGEIAAAGYRNLLVVSILKGSFVFAADLLRALHDAGLSPEVEFMSLSSYGAGTASTGEGAGWSATSRATSPGRDVLLIDDILESGRTIAFARDLMLEARRGAGRRWRCCWRSRASSPSRSRPIMSASSVPTCSSSATAWMWPTPSANCRSSAWSRSASLELLEQPLEVVALERRPERLAEPLPDRVEDLAGALGIDLVGNLDGGAEVGPERLRCGRPSGS